MARRWTPAEDRRLIDLLSEPGSVGRRQLERAAEELGRTVAACEYGRGHLLGWRPRRTWEAAEDALLAEAVENNRTRGPGHLVEVAKQIGRTLGAVRCRAHVLGFAEPSTVEPGGGGPCPGSCRGGPVR